MMKQKKIYTMLMAAGLLTAACTTDKDGLGSSDRPAPIALTATVEPQSEATAGLTRATEGATLQNNTLIAGTTQVKLYYFDNVTVDASGNTLASSTASVSGAGPYTLTAAPVAYLKTGETSALIDAVTPATGTPDPTGAATQTFTVMQDQSSEPNYRASDLMYGYGTVRRTLGTSVSAASGTVTLNHRMAKITVTVGIPASNANFSQIKGVRLISGYRTCNFQNIRTLTPGTTLTDEISDRSKLLLYNSTSTAAVTVSCVIPPQVIGYTGDDYDGDNGTTAAGTARPTTQEAARAFLEVETDIGITRYRFTQPQRLEAGHSYAITVTPQGVPGISSVTLATWGTVDGTTASKTIPGAGSSPDTYYVGGVAFKMVPVEAGANATGYTKESATAAWVSHSVASPGYKYYIAQTEVTNGLWAAVGLMKPAVRPAGAAANDSKQGQYSDADNYPVSMVNLNGADADAYNIVALNGFIDLLNRKTEGQRPAGYRFCVPTVAEWLYASAGGVHSKGYYFPGSNTASDVAQWQTGQPTTWPVAQKRANELGIYDMAGNLQELAFDYSNTTYAYAGAGHRNNDYQHGSARYYNEYDGHGQDDLGFRIVLRPVQVGDLYFSDGSWGTMWENPGKTPIGVVFSTALSDADSKAGYTAYAMALKNADNNQDQLEWCATDLQTTPITDLQIPFSNEATSTSALIADLDGLKHCNRARDNNGGTLTGLTAIRLACAYTPAAPASSSGWYLPSMGQLIQLFCNLGKVTMETWNYSGTGTAPHWDFGQTVTRATTAANNINAAMATTGLVSGTGYHPINADDSHQQDFLSSSEASATGYYDLYIHYNCGVGYYASKATTRSALSSTNGDMIRPVLAF